MIDLAQARNLLPRAVATQGRDFVYNPEGNEGLCMYEPDSRLALSKPTDPRAITGCLVGVALDLAGETRHHRTGLSVNGLCLQFPNMMTDDAEAYFQTAQTAQDSGTSWGEAYDRAEAHIKAFIRNTPDHG